MGDQLDLFGGGPAADPQVYAPRAEVPGVRQVYYAAPGKLDTPGPLPVPAADAGAAEELFCAAYPGTDAERCLVLPVRDGDLGDWLFDALEEMNLGADRDLLKLRTMHAKLLGCTLDELDEKLAAQRAEEAARKEELRQGRPKAASARVTKAKVESPEDIGKRRLSDRERELLRNLRVESNFAVYVPEEFIEDWALLKAIMQALGGSWQRKTKKRPGGFAFPDDADAQELVRLALETGEILDARAAEFFETGSELADELARWLDPKPGERFLEPSAGKGALVRALLRVCPDVDVTCVEAFRENRDALFDAGFKLWQQWDFLQAPHDLLPPFDGVAMNPPFSKRQDILHITHALRFLRPGGRLAAIASAGVLYRDDKMGREFRALVEQHDGTITKNPKGSFAHAGTMVETVLVRLTRSNCLVV